jgi:CheY-like chemotaxis protein
LRWDIGGVDARKAFVAGDGAKAAMGAEAILLVEDEASVRALTARILRRHGYTVHEARNAVEALDLLHGDLGVDLLLSDVVLPGMGGPELVEMATQTRPGLRVLFMSGYPRDALTRDGRLEFGVRLLQKPFAPDALARAVREVLDQAS